MAKLSALLIWVVMFRFLQFGPNGCLAQVANVTGEESFTRIPSEQNGNDTHSEFPEIGEGVLTSSLDKGMVPIYDLTKFFLETAMAVNPLAELYAKVDLADEDAVLDSLEHDWETWLDHFIAYTIATLVGVLFCVSMPLIGCCIWCCRKRGRCGGGYEPVEKKHAKCQRITCGSLLLTFSVVILLAVTSCFLSTRLVRDQTVPSGTMRDISSSLESIDTYFDNTQQQIEDLKSSVFETRYNQIQYKLASFSSDVQTEVGVSTGAEPLFHSLKTYVEYLPSLLDTLDKIENLTERLHNQSANLNNSLDVVISNFASDFQQCTLEQCNNSRYIIETLEMTANFTGQDLDPIRQDVLSVLQGENNISVTLQDGQEEFNQIQVDIEVACNDTISELKTELETYAGDFYSFVNDSVSRLGGMGLSQARQDINEKYTKEVDDIGYYAFIAFNGISAIALLIATLFFVALLFGCCGDRAGEDAIYCNRGKGASTLATALVFLFLFSWILMLSTTVMFLAGGLSYTEMCRHFIFKESQEDLVILDNMVTSYFNMSGASARTIMTNCDMNLPFYQAFEIDKHHPDLNISKIIDLTAFDFQGVIDELVSLNYSTGPVVMLNNDTETHLVTIETCLGDIDTELYVNMAEQEITSYDLVNISKLFEAYADELENTNPLEADLFRNYSHQLKVIYQVQVTSLMMDMGKVVPIVTSIEMYDASMNLSVFIPEMRSAQSDITNHVMRDAANATVDIIFDDITRLARRIEYNVVHMIGRCYGVSSAISVSISSVCVAFLYPFNAFWFSLGTCLLFFTLCIPIALSLVSNYRRTEPRVPIHQALGRPRLHRGRSLNHSDGVRASLGSSRGQHQYAYHQREPSLQPSAPPPAYQGTTNNGFIPDDDIHNPYSDDSGFVEYHRPQRNGGYPVPRGAQGGYPMPRGAPIRPTENYVIELRPRSTSYNPQAQGDDYEDYF